MKSSYLRIFAALIVGLFAAIQAHAQATLSTQGVLQKTTGMAVDDGDYAITFKLYTTESGGTAVWSETQSDVEVVGGVYGVQLGSVTPLNIPFDQVYYLGLTVSGGAEHFPRTKLTAAPYALSLLGQDNKFPSTGMVKMESVASGQATTTATSYAVTADDHVIYLDHTANQNITLPPASAANAGRHLVLVNKEAVAKTLTSSNYVNLAGATSTTVPATGVVELQSDGSVWRQTGGYVTPAVQAKAFVIAVTIGSTVPYNGGSYSTITLSESQDLQNCFASNTFTAPRTGFYRVSGSFTGSYNTPAPTNGYINIKCGGTCAFGVAGYSLSTFVWPATFIGQHNSHLSADVYMTVGQTFTLQIAHNFTNGIYWQGSTITILEQ